MTYSLSKAAEDDVINIYLDGRRMFGFAQAEAYHEGLLSAFDFLARYPEAARERYEIDPPARMHPYKSHLIFYRAENRGILVIRVQHAHENWAGEAQG